MNRRDFAKFSFAGLLTLAFGGLTACMGQSTIAALVTTLGNAGASVAKAIGDAALAESITTATTAAVAAVNNWKSGTGAASIAVEALNTLLANLNLIPVNPLYSTLIALAITTATSLINILSAGSNTAMKAAYHAAVSAGVPQDASHFKAQWNGICAGNMQLASVRIK